MAIFFASISTTAGARTVRAQVADTVVRVKGTLVSLDSAIVQPAPTRLSPPLTPKRAFLYSLALPGFGQSRLDRGTSGALFASIEMAALVMVRRSSKDAQEVDRYRIDTLPETFTVVNGIFVPTGVTTNRFTQDLKRARRLHVEDWLAVLAFNHLFAAADAFVAAQLWDVPVSVSMSPREGGYLVATLHW